MDDASDELTDEDGVTECRKKWAGDGVIGIRLTERSSEPVQTQSEARRKERSVIRIEDHVSMDEREWREKNWPVANSDRANCIEQ